MDYFRRNRLTTTTNAVNCPDHLLGRQLGKLPMPARQPSVPTEQLLQAYDSRTFYPRNKVRLANGQLRWVRGLSVSLKGVFYPSFKAPQSYGNSSRPLGIRVHREMEHWVNGAPEKKPAKTKNKTKTKTAAAKKGSRKKSSPAKKRAKGSDDHLYTKQFKVALKSLGLVPTAAEVPLLSFRGSFLTRTDLLCRRFDRDELVVVSLKTGYNRGYSIAGKRRACLGINRPNCYKTHHQIQLALEVASIEEDYGIPVNGAYVIYAGWGTKKTLRIDDLEPWARKESAKTAMFDMMRRDAAAQFTMPAPSTIWSPDT